MNLKALLALPILLLANVLSASGQIVVEMTPMGNVYSLSGKVNGLELNFIFDTGASDVSLSMAEAIFMVKNGYLVEDDFIGVSYSQIANGDIVENMDVVLREVEIAGIKLHNVTASISNTLEAPLLLGQSAIQKLGPIQLDGNKLIIQNGKNFKSDEHAWDLYYKAFQSIEAEDYGAAISIGNEALEYATDNGLKSLLYEQLAGAYYCLGQNDMAIECCHNGLGENPMNEQLSYNLGVILYETGDKNRAEKAFLQYVFRFEEIPPQDKAIRASAFSYLAEIQYGKGEYVDAETNYNKSLAVSANPTAYLGLGDVYATQGKYAKAAECYRKGISYEPERPSNIKRWHQLGFASYLDGNLDDARSAFEACISTYSKNADLLDGAMKTNDPELQNASADAFCYSASAMLWLARLAQSPQERISNYNAVMQIPLVMGDMEAKDYLLLASAYMDLNDTDRAKSVLTEAGRLFPDDVDVMYLLATLTEDYAEAIDLLKKVLEYEYRVQPQLFDYSYVYGNIAWAYSCLGQYENGLPYAEKSVRLAPESGISWELLGEIYFHLKRYDDCVGAMTKCISFSSQNVELRKAALTYRGKALIESGRKKEGRKDLKEAEKL